MSYLHNIFKYGDNVKKRLSNSAEKSKESTHLHNIFKYGDNVKKRLSNSTEKSKESIQAMVIKNIIYVEANIMNIFSRQK